MQRDAYAALVKKAYKLKIPVCTLQLNGRVTQENLHDECFFGYAARRLVLMTNMDGIAPAHRHLPRLPQDVMVPDFPTFLALHKPYYQYQLVPMMCRDADTFAALQAVCATPGSPFRLTTDRREPKALRYRFTQGSAHRQLVADFFQPYISPAEWSVPVASRRLPVQEVHFDGVLFRQARLVQTSHSHHSPGGTPEEIKEGTERNSCTGAPSSPQKNFVSAALYLTTHSYLSPMLLQQRMHMRDFYHSPIYDVAGPNSDVHREVKGARHVWHVMAITQPMDAVLRSNYANQAAAKNLLLYEKGADGAYKYVQPTTKPPAP